MSLTDKIIDLWQQKLWSRWLVRKVCPCAPRGAAGGSGLYSL